MNIQPVSQLSYYAPCRSHIENPEASHILSKELALRYPKPGQPIIYVCIGTDRSTGDALGPLIGSLLEKRRLPDFHIYGTLKEPVHALNLEKTIHSIYKKYPNPFVVGIDACLGLLKSVGFIEVGSGPVRPGAGVQKKLPEVGDVYIMGIVNVGGYMEHTMLHNTRLYFVNEMATIITDAIHYSSILYRKKIQ